MYGAIPEIKKLILSLLLPQYKIPNANTIKSNGYSITLYWSNIKHIHAIIKKLTIVLWLLFPNFFDTNKWGIPGSL